jgi:superfamily II DNA or RNA helicase
VEPEGNGPGHGRKICGSLTFLFTVDVLNEGLDIPEINLVMFLLPTDLGSG